VLQAANEVGLKYSTAKHIYQHFKQTGEIEKVIIKVEEDTQTRDHFLFNLSREVLKFKEEVRGQDEQMEISENQS
jgi:hypothetical protein